MSDIGEFMASVMSDPLVRDVWSRKYRHWEGGVSSEDTVAMTRERVVRGVFAKDPDESAMTTALDFVQRGLLVPAGRVNAGAGIDRQVTLMNCFVGETIQDSMIGIQRSISRAALTMQQGGGIGTDFSTIRPRGAYTSRGAPAGGVIVFMDQQSAMCETIVSGGSRRGAMMGTLRDDHPDLWCEEQFETTVDHTGATVLRAPSFVSAKRQRGRLTQFNVSVLISDAFLRAVDEDAAWDLGFHVPPMDGSHVDVLQRPFPYDAWRESNEDFVHSGEWTRELGADIRTKIYERGQMLPWYVYRRVPARRIWDDIMRSTYTYAEPGVMFIDRINARNNLYYCEEIRTSNPCAEQPLPPHGICCLSSVNTAFMVKNPFTKNAAFDIGLFERVIASGVRFLDNVLDVSRYPLEAQRAEAMSKRRVGLGITGWGDALVQLGVRYGSPRSVEFSQVLARALRNSSYLASAKLAKERGPFPAYRRNEFLAGYNVTNLASGIRDLISTNGIRNGVLNTIAPNGTISLYIGNVSSGHEPVFSFEKVSRKVRGDDGALQTYESVDYALRLYEHLHGPTPRDQLPDYFVGAMDISVEDHLAVHAAWSELIDASVSKTINVPESCSFRDFAAVYRRAYDLGCKGCTTYRPDPASGRGSVLSVAAGGSTPMVDAPGSPGGSTPMVDAPGSPGGGYVAQDGSVAPRPNVTDARVYKLKWPITGGNWYITITSVDGAPLELFITTPDADAQEWVAALSRTVTAVLRRGGDVRFLVDQLAAVHSAAGGAFVMERFRPSVVAAIAGVMEAEFRRLGLYSATTVDISHFVKSEIIPTPSDRVTVLTAPPHGLLCAECGEKTMIREQGCFRCLSCGYNTCG